MRKEYKGSDDSNFLSVSNPVSFFLISSNFEDLLKLNDRMGKMQTFLLVLCVALLVSTSLAMPVEEEEDNAVQKRFVLLGAAAAYIGVAAAFAGAAVGLKKVTS
ncbi:hypothetical protein PoB_001567200 [Plakobranchus ocellatus]|uniref:Uncharacterized protein n=1 Tax=Plakobranchus ocellatus TaxID=259542 RepID=A0AAV3Z3S7_9GAST|nr:hypothetical protein PoB_001567200 [Plakobranchus ocellatus]